MCAALVVANGPNAADEAVVRRHCVLQLPPAKVPRRVTFVRELPRTGRGKVSRDDALRLLAAHDGHRS